MDTIEQIFKWLNQNVGLTVFLSVIGFAINEWIKGRNAKKLHKAMKKIDHINPRTVENEEKLHKILTKFYLSTETNESHFITASDEIRIFIIENSLYLSDKVSRTGILFSDYILEAYNTSRDLKKEEAYLNKIKSIFRS